MLINADHRLKSAPHRDTSDRTNNILFKVFLFQRSDQEQPNSRSAERTEKQTTIQNKC